MVLVYFFLQSVEIADCVVFYSISSKQNLSTDIYLPFNEVENAVDYWYKIQSPMGKQCYKNFTTLLVLHLLASNEDSKRVFSLVRQIKRDFHSSLQTETITAVGPDK